MGDRLLGISSRGNRDAGGSDDHSDDNQHEAQIIDLRDPRVADGLADALADFGTLSERAGAAEAKAEQALHDRLAATGRVRELTRDLEAEQAERHRLEIDNAELRREAKLRAAQVQDTQAELERWRNDLAEFSSAAETRIEWLRSELAHSHRAIHTLEALVGRRKRKNYRELLLEQET